MKSLSFPDLQIFYSYEFKVGRPGAEGAMRNINSTFEDNVINEWKISFGFNKIYKWRFPFRKPERDQLKIWISDDYLKANGMWTHAAKFNVSIGIISKYLSMISKENT